MSKRFPVYELFLKLYPKSYRAHYADQMVQTLADMLDDQLDGSGRFMVWLRASSELPVGIVQQNITAIGEEGMGKLATTTNKRLAIIAGVAAVAIVAVGSYSWARYTALPNSVGAFYRHGIVTTLTDQNKKLTDPMTQLYGKLPTAAYTCANNQSGRISTVIICDSTMQGYAKLPQDDTGKQRILKSAQTIDAALKAEGYRGGSNGVTLSSLVGGTYQGKDYSPDAFYEKVVGNHYDCTIDTTIAYANPAPAAISTHFSCTRPKEGGRH
jgi:hypothetical protein